tara:strand:+ start:6030 stop:6230 length:201 start_codon:yes stop_codon:yes gene_type:complete
MEIFKLAGIESGCIDYAVGMDGLVVFKINSNPCVLKEDENDTETDVWYAAAVIFCEGFQSLNKSFP